MTLTLSAVLLIFGVIGALAGGFAFLFHMLVSAKDTRIKELVDERDYYRSASLLERGSPSELHPAALPAGTIIVRGGHDKDDDDDKPQDESRFAYYSLAIQAGISIVVLLGAFILIIAPTEPTVNALAGNLIIFVIGVWLGRGVDTAQARLTSKKN